MRSMSMGDTKLAGTEVLLVDDDPTFREFVSEGLGEHGVNCSTAADGHAALRVLSGERRSPDVVLLDIMLPGPSGWDVLEQIRRQDSQLPVIFVTAREAVDERVRGLRMGADDYIIKPFAFVELLARLESVVRRRRETVVRHGDLCIDVVERECRVGERRLNLAPRELQVLLALVRSPGIVSKAGLLKMVWRTDIDPETNVVEVHIARLRRKLAAAGGPGIFSERGKGYALSSTS
jgi:DNA-binding response OmpR family regulator